MRFAFVALLLASVIPPSAARAGEADSDLIKSILRSDLESARFLLASGADVNALSERGETALMLARRGGNDDAVAMLKEAGARELFFAPLGEPALRASSPEGFSMDEGKPAPEGGVPGGPGSGAGRTPEPARPPPLRSAMEVDDAFAPYAPQDWIVSPLEEPEGDAPAGTTPPELDIRGVLSCADASHLRVDIVLHREIASDRTAGFGVKLSYDGGVNEYFTYFTGLNRLYYVREAFGRIQKSHRLFGEGSSDNAGLAGKNVYILIEKDAHMAGERGRPYRVGALFFSLTLDGGLIGHVEDRTIPVDLRYTR
jgi:hypothetical protein